MKRKVLIILGILLFIVISIIGYCMFDNEHEGYLTKVKKLLSDTKEIERKWLIKVEDIPYDLNAKNVYVYDILQTYISFNPEMRVRNYNNGESYEFTIKNNMSKDGMVRDEFNLIISKEQYDNLIKKQEGITIHKTRYQFLDKENVIAIDIFHDELSPLAYMEIEFLTEEESYNYVTPNWVIKEVTDDISYKNGYLARFGIPQR